MTGEAGGRGAARPVERIRGSEAQPGRFSRRLAVRHDDGASEPAKVGG
jgi:hypothetical protein